MNSHVRLTFQVRVVRNQIIFLKNNIVFLCSPEVLAQANAGNAPHMPPLPTQKVLTLEEIERQAAAVRI